VSFVAVIENSILNIQIYLLNTINRKKIIWRELLH